MDTTTTYSAAGSQGTTKSLTSGPLGSDIRKFEWRRRVRRWPELEPRLPPSPLIFCLAVVLRRLAAVNDMNGLSNIRLDEETTAIVLSFVIPRDCWEEQSCCALRWGVSSVSPTGSTLFGLVAAESGKEPGICSALGAALLGVDGLTNERAGCVRTIIGVVDLDPPPRDVCIESALMVSRKCVAVTSVDSDASQACRESRVGDWADSTMFSLIDRKMTSVAS